MVALMVVMIDKGFNLRFEVTRQEVMFEQNAVLQGLVPALDLALGLGVIRRAARVLHAFAVQPLSKFTRDVAGSVVAEQTRLVDDVNLITTGRLQSEVKRVGHVLCPHVGPEFPRDDVAAVVVEDRAEIEPPPADDLQIGEVGLPKLIDRGGFVFELVRSLDRCE